MQGMVNRMSITPMPEEQNPSETPLNPENEAVEVVDGSASIETFDSVDIAETSDTPEASDMPEVSNTLETSDTPEASDTSETSDAEAVEFIAEASTEDEDFISASESDDEDLDHDEGGEDHPDSHLKRGQIVEGRIVKTSPTEVIVDLGENIEGIINSRELERLTSATLETLAEGNVVLVYVLTPKGQGGQPILSISRALEEQDWRHAESFYKEKKVYYSKVAGYNKGGLVVRFGRLRGFVPASQISQERRLQAAGENPEDRWGDMIGDPIAIKVVELNRARNRLILSEQAAAREVRELQKSKLISELNVGEIRTGRVISLSDFGAFVDLGGADGLVHLTEITWKHITHPKEILHIGQEVTVQVINVDPDHKRIGLSIRRLEEDPWDQVERQYKIGQLIRAEITKLTKFGAFARLVNQPEVEGLIHISELAEHRVNHPREVVKEGDVLALRILKMDRDQRRIGLSLKQVDSYEYLDVDWEMAEEKLNS